MLQTNFINRELAAKDIVQIDALQDLLMSNSCYATRVYKFEKFLETFSQVKVEPKHEFADGICKREIVFEAGTLATGKLHTRDHMDVMLEGEMLVATPDGFKRLIAPCTMITKAGSKKAGIALKRTRWLSFHPTQATTREELEQEIVCEDNEIGELICR